MRRSHISTQYLAYKNNLNDVHCKFPSSRFPFFTPYLRLVLNIFDNFTILSKIYGPFACEITFLYLIVKFTSVCELDELEQTRVHANIATCIYICMSMNVCVVQTYTTTATYQFVQIVNHGLFLFLTLNSSVCDKEEPNFHEAETKNFKAKLLITCRDTLNRWVWINLAFCCWCWCCCSNLICLLTLPAFAQKVQIQNLWKFNRTWILVLVHAHLKIS